jgi:putative toxin-antitoxin system antitoxin component (TIGR02293 family)
MTDSTKAKTKGTTGNWEKVGGVRSSKITVRDALTGSFLASPSEVEALKKRGYSSAEIFEIVAPRRTLARRKERGEKLSAAESDRVHRLERISGMADRVFGNHDKAQRWLRSEVGALDRAKPIDLLQSETGAYLVEQELVRIDFGMLA